MLCVFVDASIQYSWTKGIELKCVAIDISVIYLTSVI